MSVSLTFRFLLFTESQRELRKRRVSLVQMPPPKRRRPDTSKGLHLIYDLLLVTDIQSPVCPSFITPVLSALPSPDRSSQSQQAGSDSVPASPALTPDQTNTQTPTDAGIEAPSDIGK